jgi:multidrug resistance efflux pump
VSELDLALKRLDQALDAAEAAVARALDAADAARAREEELRTFADDRLRLAELLDVSAAQAEAMKSARQEIGRRLDLAIEAVESVLGESGA